MCVPSMNFIEWICCSIRLRLVGLIGMPYDQRAHVASHLEVSSSSLVYWLKSCSLRSYILRLCRVPVVILMSSAYPWSSYVMCVASCVVVWYEGR